MRVPTSTPDTFAQVLVRDAVDLSFGDRVLHFQHSWAELLTVIDVSADGNDYVHVHYVYDNDVLDGVFPSRTIAKFAVLTAGVCDNLHSGRALMCTPAPFRLDARPWPGSSSVCDAHRQQMHAAHDAIAP